MGDPLASYVTERTTDEQYDMLAEKHGVNEPLPVRYVAYLRSIITFDWGYSQIAMDDVSNALRDKFAATLELSILGQAHLAPMRCLKHMLGTLPI